MNRDLLLSWKLQQNSRSMIFCLNFLAERHPECKLEKRTSDEIYEPFYVVQGPFGTRVIRMNAVGTITQIKNSVHWFQNDLYP